MVNFLFCFAKLYLKERGGGGDDLYCDGSLKPSGRGCSAPNYLQLLQLLVLALYLTLRYCQITHGEPGQILVYPCRYFESANVDGEVG
jgi:hypothetical protein